MSLAEGTVAIDEAGSVTGSGFALAIFNALIPIGQIDFLESLDPTFTGPNAANVAAAVQRAKVAAAATANALAVALNAQTRTATATVVVPSTPATVVAVIT